MPPTGACRWKEAGLSLPKPEPTAAAAGPAGPPTRWQRFAAWYQEKRLRLTIGLLAILFLVALYAPDIFISILPGQQGVLWSRFFGGTRLGYTLDEGLRLKFPWDKVWIYDVRMMQATDTFNAITSDGLTLEVEITLRYRLVPVETPYLHKFVGPDYLNVLVLPEVASQARQEISKYEPEVFYTRRREEIENDILENLREGSRIQLAADGMRRGLIFIEDFLIRSITLPPQVDAAIQSKLAQRHLMLEYDYRIDREKKEAERKGIEAQGIRLFQDTVSEGISPQYLQWKGIDATLALAQSTNAKIVIVGGGADGLPIILGNMDSVGATAAAPAPPRTGAGAGSIAPAPGRGPSSPPPTGRSGAGSGAIEGATGRGPSSPPPETAPAGGGPPPQG